MRILRLLHLFQGRDDFRVRHADESHRGDDGFGL